MHKQYATKLCDKYMREHSDARDLSFREQNEVIYELLKTKFDHEADINDVAEIVERQFPQENQMHRPYNPTQKPQQKQSIDEVRQIIEYFVAHYWPTYTRAIPPTENGQKKNNINYMAFGTAVRNRFNEGK